MTPLPALPDDRPESIRRVECAWRDADYCLHVEDVPAWLPTLDEEKKALASLSKAWPILSKHADHIDGEFDLALTDVRKMFASLRAEIAAYAALTHGAHADTARLAPAYVAWDGYRTGYLDGLSAAPVSEGLTYEELSACADLYARKYADAKFPARSTPEGTAFTIDPSAASGEALNDS